MTADLYQKLSHPNLLRRAWHLARNDSRTDFMFDPFRFSDFAFRLEEHLSHLSESLARGSYHPNPLLLIDVPKSTLSVRPGTVVSIEDKIVLFAIACLIAPPLDKKLPEAVYSWRVKPQAKRDDLFHDHELLSFPFLKRKTIQRELELVEPWYALWPEFLASLETAYEKEGYRFLVSSDIVAYFENVDLGLLRDLLLQHLPRQPRLVNFLIGLLEYWTWPTLHGSPAPRGIPQGNGMSSFLGNIYLLPLDQAFAAFARRKDVKYLRYMDDVKVLAKDRATAREALFLMNDHLRGLRLNIQGSKTRIFEEGEIHAELFDERLDRTNNLIKAIQKNKNVTAGKRAEFIDSLKEVYRQLRGRKGVIRDKELRLFRRLITAFTTLRSSTIVSPVLDQLDRNPDSRLLNSAVRYLRVQDGNRSRISTRLGRLLSRPDELFPYQEAHLLMTLRYMRNIPSQGWEQAKSRLKSKTAHWYVRQQAALLLALKPLGNRELAWLLRLYNKERGTEVKRALVHPLSQLNRDSLEPVVRGLVFASDPRLNRIGRFLHSLLFEEARAIEHLNNLFDNITDEVMIDRLYELEVLAKCRSAQVRQRFVEKAMLACETARRPLLKSRLTRLTASSAGLSVYRPGQKNIETRA
ncbi:MAG: RNA-directed DNA polymerase [Gemmataceae bacterium]|nr:RNA-directed DNA polymerase [Gemmataceae bacterium]